MCNILIKNVDKLPDRNVFTEDSCMAINSSGNWQFMPCDHEFTVVCQQNKSTVNITTSMPQNSSSSSIPLGKNVLLVALNFITLNGDMTRNIKILHCRNSSKIH